MFAVVALLFVVKAKTDSTETDGNDGNEISETKKVLIEPLHADQLTEEKNSNENIEQSKRINKHRRTTIHPTRHHKIPKRPHRKHRVVQVTESHHKKRKTTPIPNERAIVKPDYEESYDSDNNDGLRDDYSLDYENPDYFNANGLAAPYNFDYYGLSDPNFYGNYYYDNRGPRNPHVSRNFFYMSYDRQPPRKANWFFNSNSRFQNNFPSQFRRRPINRRF